MTAGRPYLFTFCDGGGTADFDTYLALRDSVGTTVATNDDSCGLLSELLFNCTTSGYYYLEVNSCCTGSFGGTYTLAHKRGECISSGYCEDGNVCTDDICTGSGVDKVCTFPNNSASCNDGIYCNGTDTCSGGSCSIHTGDPCPGPDGDGDCSESCNESSDNCTANDPYGSACDDGLYCNGGDVCSSGSCSVHSGDPCPGPDGDGDCSESCNESSNNCTANDPNGSVCTDGLWCNGSDACSNGSCSSHAGDPCPGPDGDGDCSESCNESSDSCTANDPDGSVCTDGLWCNGSDACVSGNCASHAGDPCPGPDGDGDCSESCNESSDSCTANDPNGSFCNDGQWCNGSDACVSGDCASHTGDPCPGPDGDGDCSESCNESSDNCTANDPNGTVCTDGLFCNGEDYCLGGSCSVHDGDPCPGTECNECNEAVDSCYNPAGTPCGDPLSTECDDADTCDGFGICLANFWPAGTECSDGVFCNGEDSCDGAGVCEPTGYPCDVDEWCYEPGDDCIPYGDGDFDLDGDVDLVDFAGFQICYEALAVNQCEAGNMTGTGYVELDDLADFYAVMTGP